MVIVGAVNVWGIRVLRHTYVQAVTIYDTTVYDLATYSGEIMCHQKFASGIEQRVGW